MQASNSDMRYYLTAIAVGGSTRNECQGTEENFGPHYLNCWLFTELAGMPSPSKANLIGTSRNDLN
jgi:hypothetical protein